MAEPLAEKMSREIEVAQRLVSFWAINVVHEVKSIMGRRYIRR